MVKYINKWKNIYTKKCNFVKKLHCFIDFSISIVVFCFSKGDKTNGWILRNFGYILINLRTIYQNITNLKDDNNNTGERSTVVKSWTGACTVHSLKYHCLVMSIRLDKIAKINFISGILAYVHAVSSNCKNTSFIFSS